jgi:hypothetical protein
VRKLYWVHCTRQPAEFGNPRAETSKGENPKPQPQQILARSLQQLLLLPPDFDSALYWRANRKQRRELQLDKAGLLHLLREDLLS